MSPSAAQQPNASGEAYAGADPAPDDGGEEEQHRRHPGESQLLADDAEDEVGVRRGEEEELLPALAEADAERPARAESEQRLHRLVAVAARILPGIEEGEHPLDAVRRLPDQHRRDGRQRAGHGQQPGEPRAGDEEEREGDDAEHHGGAEVGLQHQQHAEERRA